MISLPGRKVVPALLALLILTTVGCGGTPQNSNPTPTLLSMTLGPTSTGLFSIAEIPQQQFVASGNFSDGTIRDVTTAVTWSSNPAGVLTFDPAAPGFATFVATGTTTITATSSAGKVATSTVRVIP